MNNDNELVISVQHLATQYSYLKAYTLQSLLIIKNKTWLVKRIWLLIQLKWQFKKKSFVQLPH